jgi:hypothetical protein
MDQDSSLRLLPARLLHASEKSREDIDITGIKRTSIGQKLSTGGRGGSEVGPFLTKFYMSRYLVPMLGSQLWVLCTSYI